MSMSSRYAANMGHLSLFNQQLQQQSKHIEWVFSDSAGQGTRTTPIWVVRAMVDERCIGSGRGSTKKAAKNEAAKEGLRNMGIIVRWVDEWLLLRSININHRRSPYATLPFKRQLRFVARLASR